MVFFFDLQLCCFDSHCNVSNVYSTGPAPLFLGSRNRVFGVYRNTLFCDLVNVSRVIFPYCTVNHRTEATMQKVGHIATTAMSLIQPVFVRTYCREVLVYSIFGIV